MHTPDQIAIAKIIRDYWTQPDEFVTKTGLKLVKPAFPAFVANGFIGNQEGEYSLSWPPARGDHRKAYGAAQWHHDPKNDRVGYILSHTGIDVRSDDCLSQQRGMWFELTTSCAHCLKLIKEADNEEHVIIALVNFFEYSGLRNRDIARRTPFALAWRAYFGDDK